MERLSKNVIDQSNAFIQQMFHIIIQNLRVNLQNRVLEETSTNKEQICTCELINKVNKKKFKDFLKSKKINIS